MFESYEEVFSGWVVRNRSRKLDAQKNPTNEWSEWRYRSAYGSVNPYVYKKGKHRSKNLVTNHPEYDNSNFPSRNNVQYETDEYNAWWKEYVAWRDNRPIIGYFENETQVVPAKIVVEA